MNRYETYQFISQCMELEFHPELSSAVIDTLQNKEINWKGFFSLSSNHLVLQIIYRVYRDLNILNELPKEVLYEMEKIFSLAKERNTRLLKQSVEINEVLINRSILPIFTKGIGHLMNGLYQDAGERVMADIDLIVAFDDLVPAINVLKDSGYIIPKDLNPKLVPRLKHHPRIYKPGEFAQVELHWEPIKPKYRNLLTTELVMSHKMKSIHYPGCHTMSWAHAVQHNFIHSQLEHRSHRYAKVFLRNMYDFALLSNKTDVNNALKALGRFQKQAASYIVLTEKTFNIRNLSTEDTKDKSSKFFFFKYEVNLRYRIPYLLIRLIERIYHSYIHKFFRSFIDKQLRTLIFKQLTSKKWYKHHMNTYRKMFGRPQK